MTPKQLMLIGVFAAIVAATGIIIVPETGGMSGVMLFAGGALFGKGYGIWEEREKRRQ